MQSKVWRKVRMKSTAALVGDKLPSWVITLISGTDNNQTFVLL